MEEKYNILVVDDDPIMLEQAENILCLKYNVSLAISGKQAIEYLNSIDDINNLPNLILLDILMPKMNGYETLSRIRKIDKYKEIPIIFLTGISSPEFEVRCLESGASDYITKPFSPSVLLARISVALKNMIKLQSDYEVNTTLLTELAEELTKSELKVLTLMVRSYNNREISTELNYSYAYVKKLSCNILSKLGLKNRNEIKKYRQ